MTQKILHASGPYTGNGTHATLVGGGALDDSSDSSYIQNTDEHHFGYSVKLDALTGYESGDAITLHVRLSITGDGTPVDANAQIFIATDAAVVDKIGGFSDGSVSGFGFAIPTVDGTILDLTAPLSMGAWSPSTEPDVVTALEAGAYLDFNDIINSNWTSGTPTVRVYEAWVTVGEDTEPTEVDLPCDEWVNLDLSTAVQLGDDTGPFGQYTDGVIVTVDGDPDFWFDFEVDPAKAYQVTVTYDPDYDPDLGGRDFGIYALRPGHETDDHENALEIGYSNYSGSPVPTLWRVAIDDHDDAHTFTIGPGRGPGPGSDDDVPNWDDPTVGVAQGYTRLWFESTNNGALSQISIMKICTTFAPPLRQYPRNDGLGTSSARRVYPPPPTVQASNRRGPTAIL